MLKEGNRPNPVVVDLTDNILLHTDIAVENHAALRSGFAGYPANPRWNVSKFHAWKTGRQLREALAQGQMVVRSTDSMLIPISLAQEKPPEKPKPNPVWSQIPSWMKHIRKSYQTT
ncbi:conserved hypothetical protein [Gloeothece citriformis PCC 7424]|uniref:Uncharacterized protein n=1 Tax=Gloeothece citriformis (strain PCC 7424) TaxID=65393 RepID=B7K7L9_GLOC7|nr:hypothetical protein [Gloeothece citriformis]ACK69787.1 conserved hypothetical protein [Gloeothece citriformis PCC 7424]